MLRLLAFDLARLIRPRPASVYQGYLHAMRRLPAELRKELDLRGDLIFARSLDETDRHLARRRDDDAARLLAVLTRIARRRGFPAVTWQEGGHDDRPADEDDAVSAREVPPPLARLKSAS